MSITAYSDATGPEGIPLKHYNRRWGILWVLNLSLVLVVMGNSAVNVALPTWEKEIGATFTQLQWIVDGYALAFGGLLLTMGALGDRFGRRGALQAGLAIFGLSSLWAALWASEPWHLIASRTVMGVGAALVMPATLSILTTVFPRDERGKAIGIWVAFAGIGGVIGLLSSGGLLEFFDWPSIFWVNVVVVALALGFGMWLVPTSKDPQQRPTDIVGSVLSILAIGSLLYAIIEGPIEGWTSPLILGAIVGGLVTLALFILWERHSAHPMLPMSFFKERGFNGGVIVISLVFFAMFAMFFILIQFLQAVQGHGTFAAALRFLPMTFGMIAAAPNSDKVVRRLGVRPVVGGGLVLVALGLLALSFLTSETPFWYFGSVLVLLGVGMGFSMAPATTVIMSSIPSHKAGVGSSMNDTAREVGGAFGIAILGSILKEVYQNNVGDKLPAGVPDGARDGILSGIGGAGKVAGEIGGPTGGAIFAAAQQAFLDAMFPAFLTAAILVAAAAVVVTVYFPRDKALVLGGHGGPDIPSVPDMIAATPLRPSPLAFAVTGGWLVAHRGSVSAPLWRHDLRGLQLVPDGGPAQTHDAVFFAIRQNGDYHAVALRVADGTEMWRRALPTEPVAVPAILDDRVVWELRNGGTPGANRVTFSLVDGRLRGRVRVTAAP